MAFAAYFICSFFFWTAANSIQDECESVPATTTDISLMQRTWRTAHGYDPSDEPVSHGFSISVPAQLTQLSEGVSGSMEQLEHWEDEIEQFAEHLHQRRAQLQRLRRQHPEPLKLALNGNTSTPGFVESERSVMNRTDIDKSLILPVPYYIHQRSNRQDAVVEDVTTEEVKPWYGKLLGDALDPSTGAAGHGSGHGEGHDGHGKGHITLLFLFGSLIIGSCLQLMLDRYAPSIPYTCSLFIAGGVCSLIHWLNRHGQNWETWYDSVDMWQAINPHLLFFAFLPALLFGDVMKLKVQLVATCSGQIFLLACPGVLLGTGLTGLFAKCLLPYGWDWPICLVFGSILAATDPVAVVSLFNSLGVSPRLTMLISGESLVNDGTAIVCFALALKVAQGAETTFLATAYFFVHMIAPAILIGFGTGFAAVALISLCSETVGESDGMIQVVVTLCCGYLAFFISENEFSSSGVIATVVAGLAVAHSAWPLFVSRETVRVVWEAVEFVGNTVIFFLAGLIFTNTILERSFGLQDFILLLILYAGMFVIRTVMLALLWMPLNQAGEQIVWQEGVVMVWSGLRGAVSLAMGMIVDIEPGIKKSIGSQVMFHVGGIAALTLLVNSVTTGPLLRLLGLVKTETQMNRVSSKLSNRISDHVKTTFAKELNNAKDVRFSGANREIVQSMVPVLREDAPAHDGGSREELLRQLRQRGDARTRRMSPGDLDSFVLSSLVQSFREVFLRVVQSRYWQAIEAGVIPRQLMVSRVLLHSVEENLNNTDKLSDWEIITKSLRYDKETKSLRDPTSVEVLLSKLVDIWPLKLIPQFRKASLDFQTMMTVFVALSYIEAHRYAQEAVPQSLGRDDALNEEVQRHVKEESEKQTQEALEFVATLPTEFVELGRSEMLARRLLRQLIKEVEHKKEEGFLTSKEAEHLCEPSHDALHLIQHVPLETWCQKIREKVESRKSSSEAPPNLSPTSRESQRPPIVSSQLGASQAPQLGASEAHMLQAMRHTSDPGAALVPGSGTQIGTP